MKKIIFTCILMAVSQSTLADGYRQQVEAFFTKVEQRKVEKALDDLFLTNPWMNKNSDELKQVKFQLMQLDQLMGEYNGKELMMEKVIVDRFAHLSFLALYDRQPLEIVFQFYKPKDKWMIQNFYFDGDFSDRVKEAAVVDTAMGRP